MVEHSMKSITNANTFTFHKEFGDNEIANCPVSADKQKRISINYKESWRGIYLLINDQILPT